MNNTDRRIQNWYESPILPVLLVAAALVIRLYRLTAESFWFDEAYAVAFAMRPLRDFSPFRLEGPPFTDRNLFHLLLHFWLVLGKTDWFLRLLPALIGSLSVFGSFLLTEELFGRRAAIWSGLLFAVSPLHVWYSQEVRMYILVTMFSLFSAYFLLRSLRIGRLFHWISFVLCTAAAMYTHSFAIFVVFAQGLYVLYSLLLRKIEKSRVLNWMVALVAVGILCVPLGWGLVNQQQQGWWDWITVRYGSARLRDVLDTLIAFAYGTTFSGPRLWRWLAMLTGFASIVLAVATVKLEDRTFTLKIPLDGDEIFCLFWLLAPLAAILVLSQFRNMYVLRYLLPFMPPLVILMGRGIERTRPVWLRVLMILVILVASGHALMTAFSKPQKEDWRGLAQHLEEQVGPDDVIVLVDADTIIPFQRYYLHETDMELVWRGVTATEELEEIVDGVVLGHENVWLVLSHTTNRSLETTLDARSDMERRDSRSYTGGVDLIAYHIAGANQ